MTKTTVNLTRIVARAVKKAQEENFDVVLINTFINDDVDSNNETTEENEEN